EAQDVAPLVGGEVVLRQREAHRAADGGGETAHPRHFLLPRGEVLADDRRITATSSSGAERSSPITPAGASSKRPVPSSPSTLPMPNSSSSAAYVPGTGSPSTALCMIVRDVEKPSAPARMPSRTRSAIASMSSGVAGSFRAPRPPLTETPHRTRRRRHATSSR